MYVGRNVSWKYVFIVASFDTTTANVYNTEPFVWYKAKNIDYA